MSIVNLLPKNYQRQRNRQRLSALCLVMLLFVMIGVVAAVWMSGEKAEAVQKANEEVCQEYRAAAESIAQIRQLEANKKQVIAKAEMAADLLERVPRSYLLACLTNYLPEGASLNSIKMKTTAIKRAKPAGKPKTKFRSRASRQANKAASAPTRPKLKVSLQVTGLAETDIQVSQFIRNVRANPLLGTVELGYSEEKEIEGVVLREFQVTMSLAANAEVDIDPEAPQPLPAETVTTAWEGRGQ